MKKKPLKLNLTDEDLEAYVNNERVMQLKKKKKQVEWLKKEITSYPTSRTLNYKILIETIDEAFEDVIEVKQ